MTSTLNETILKVKTALDNVFVKKTDIKNNLVSTDTDKPLSANQGKELNDNKVDKISGKGLSKNDFTDTYKGKLDDLDTNLNNKANATHNHGNLQSDGSVGTSDNVSKNVITDGNGKITTEDKIVASDTKPSADTSAGNKGTSTDYARADHVHPKSSIYAASSHSHGNLSNDGKVSTTSSATMLYFCGVGSSANTLYKSNKLSSNIIIDATAYSNLGTSANTNQSDINAAIDSLIGQAITYINQ